MNKFSRDKIVEQRAFDAGWSIEKINKCRLSDLKNIFPENNLQSIVTNNKKPSFVNQTLNPPIVNMQYHAPEKLNQSDLNTGKTQDDVSPIPAPIEVNDINKIQERQKKLQIELDCLNEKAKTVRNYHHTTDEFDLKQVCKLKDSAIHINVYFENKCQQYTTLTQRQKKKTELLLEISQELDDEEIEMIRKSDLADKIKLAMYQKDLEELCHGLEEIISRKLKVLNLLDNSYDDGMQQLVLAMKGKLHKIQILFIVIQQKTKDFRNASGIY
jgi:hypothetical protein